MKMVYGARYIICGGDYKGSVVKYVKDIKGNYLYAGIIIHSTVNAHQNYTHFPFGSESDFPLILDPMQFIEDFIK